MTALQSLVFDVRAIREQGGLSVSGPLAAALDLSRVKPAVPASPPEVELEFSLGGNRLLLEGRVRGAWNVPCSRCLADHPAAFDARFDETYALDAETLDVSSEVAEAMLLEVPQRSLCRPDCRGLCPQCGKNLNADPCACRPPAPAAFEALKKLKKD